MELKKVSSGSWSIRMWWWVSYPKVTNRCIKMGWSKLQQINKTSIWI